MNSSTPEPQSGDINFKDFTKRRMLHVVLPLFIVSIIAFLDRVNIAYAGLTMKENTMVDARSIWYGGRHFLYWLCFV